MEVSMESVRAVAGAVQMAVLGENREIQDNVGVSEVERPGRKSPRTHEMEAETQGRFSRDKLIGGQRATQGGKAPLWLWLMADERAAPPIGNYELARVSHTDGREERRERRETEGEPSNRRSGAAGRATLSQASLGCCELNAVLWSFDCSSQVTRV